MSDTPETAPGRRWYHLRPEPRLNIFLFFLQPFGGDNE